MAVAARHVMGVLIVLLFGSAFFVIVVTASTAGNLSGGDELPTLPTAVKGVGGDFEPLAASAETPLSERGIALMASNNFGCYYNANGKFVVEDCNDPGICQKAPARRFEAECLSSGLARQMWVASEKACREKLFKDKHCRKPVIDNQNVWAEPRENGEECYCSNQWYHPECLSKALCVFNGKYTGKDSCLRSGCRAAVWAEDQSQCQQILKRRGNCSNLG